MKITQPPICPHCNKQTDQYDVSNMQCGDGFGWGTPFLYVCLNDDCPLYVKGQQHIKEKYGQSASYRYMIHPETGVEEVLAAVNPKLMEKRLKALMPKDTESSDTE